MQDLVQRNRRILVIDDNRSIHEDFRKILLFEEAGASLHDAEAAFFGEAHETDPQLGVQLDGACQGQEGLQKVADAIAAGRPYAVAFVDMRMPPGWNGLTTIEELWKVDPDLEVVICTAYSDQSWSDICRRLGYTDRLLILKKPFDNAEVCQLALALTEKWNLAWQARLKQDDLERLVDERTAQLRETEALLRQKQKLETIGCLAGGIAHEFNNLLQVIRGYTRFVLDELPCDGQPHDDLTRAMEAVDRAAAITRQLLSFSRRQPVRKSKQEVNEIVTTTLKMVRPLLGEQIALDVDLSDQAGIVWADADTLSQVLLNLCINARDAMPSGGRLRIATGEHEIGDRRGRPMSASLQNLIPGRYSVIAVTDTGCGIPAELRERIFDPFFTTKEVGKGTGMGLAMVFGTVQDHNGTVTVESVEGCGSTFNVFLPLVPQLANDTVCRANENQDLLLTGNETILVAEDEPMVCDVAVRILRKAGYSVITAADGEDAVQKFEEHANAIDVALLDVTMPKLSGHQVYKQMKLLNPAVKAIFCTGYDPETPEAALLEDVRTSTVHKPFAAEALLSTVRRTLDEPSSCQPA